MSKISENTLEQTALDWLEFFGWQTAFGSDISLDLFGHTSKRRAARPECGEVR
ncbi:MAG: hypothetical protein J7K15_03045 [Deltaproteobacteria bacterium]|nr:hypothetical protein [Deltaproteobacteria bacterium]